MEDMEVLVISPSSSEEDTRLSNITCKQEDEEELKPHICLKKNTDMGLDMEDCFILDYNPFDSVDIAKLSLTINDDDDLSVLAEKGKVACRDYPHSRHLCVRYPFHKTPHEKHCKRCYCYVCDSKAPCEFWDAHSDASEHAEHWRSERNSTILKARPRTL